MPQGSMDLIAILLSASWGVQFVIVILLFFSLFSWAIIFIKFFTLRRDYKGSMRFQEVFWESANFSEVQSQMKVMGESPLSRVFMAACKELKNLGYGGGASSESRKVGLETLKRTLRRSSTEEMTRMGRLVSFLATCGNTSPFIGLFGTVWGIMDAFHGIGLTGSANLAVVAPAISEALVATALGLAVAIPAVVAYNSFLNKIRLVSTELDNFSSDFLNLVEHDLRRVQGVA